MSTKYFQQFLDQLNATGKMKADGYDLSLFQKMSVSDLKNAEDLLVKALNQGDWNSIDALCAIGSERAIQELEKVFPAIASNRFLKFKLASYLFTKTRNESYKEYILPKFEKYDDTDRVSTVISIPNLPDAKSYIDTLLYIALEDRYNVVRFHSGVSLLKIKDLVRNDDDIEKYRPILSQLAHESKEKRLHGIGELKKLL